MVNKAIKLDSVLDLSNTEDLRVQFEAAAISGKKEVVIDGSEVQRIKTPAVQLILSLNKTLEEEGSKLSIENPSDILQKAIHYIGVAEILNIVGDNKS